MSEQSAVSGTSLRLLGKGGSAVVHEAELGGRRVAIKRPRREVLERRPEARTLFEREYYTLAQLAHPNIVEVYGYGIDEDGPYYAMELLTEDLSAQLPMHYREACAVLRDVAAALALVHARRLVHRDVTLHNVRRNADGRAKLMDFGAMTPMGTPEHTIGTPAYMAPETVYRQALDQRTDLYALGALAYRMLSGQDAYSARRIDLLRDAWRSRPRPLTERNPEIPAQLEELVRQLMSLNPEGRPRTAAEVIVRLSAIADLPEIDDAEIARAYLATPSMVGREAELSAIRRHVLQSARGRGAALLVEGPSGIGRSRLLDACLVDGQLIGARVLRARAEPGSVTPFALIAGLAKQLVDLDPLCLPLDARIRELVEGVQTDPTLPPRKDDLLQQELVAWFLKAATKSILFLVDDLQHADLQSAAVLLRLVVVAASEPITVICSAPSGAGATVTHALRLLHERATVLALGPLDEQQTFALVRSLFDDVDNVQLAARRIYDVARGNPRASVDLAEWLVAEGHVLHEGGRWLIPDTLAALPLPARVEDALRQRLAQLSPHATTLATAVAIARDAELPVYDYSALLAQPESVVQAALAELLAAQVFSESGQGHQLSQDALAKLLVAMMDPATLAAVHQRIARVCLARSDVHWGIYHLFYGGERREALALLLAELSRGASPANILHSLEERVAFMRALLDFALADLRPARELFALKFELVRRAEIKVSLARSEIAELSSLYRQLSGYDEWAALPKTMDPRARAMAALESAARRHAQTGPEAQILEPQHVLPSMVGFVSACLSGAASNSELTLIEQLPSLEPFAPISELVRMLVRWVEATKDTIGGRADVASATFIALLEELEGELGAKFGASTERMRRHTMVAIGMLNAGLSRSIALDYADRLQALALETKDAYVKSTSLRVRHQYHLRRGNFRQAQHWYRELELDKLTDRSAVFNPAGVYALSWIYATVGNVDGMRDCLTQIREYSAASEGLRTWESFVAAEYDRLRGAHEEAVAQYLALLDEPAGRHMAWMYAAHGVLLCLCELDRLAEGRALGAALLLRAETAQLSVARGLILRPLSLIEARLGDFATAERYLAENIEQCRLTGMGGINLGIAYEFRARVAVWARDGEAFQHYIELCAELYHAAGGSPDLTARFDGLLNDARIAGVVESGWQSRQREVVDLSNDQVELRDRLADCPSSESRHLLALQLLVQMTQTAGGLLWRVGEDGAPTLLASEGCDAPSDEVRVAVRAYLEEHAHRDARTQTVSDVTMTESDATATLGGAKSQTWQEESCAGFVPLVLRRDDQAERFGVVLLRYGSSAPRATDRALLQVVIDALTADEVRPPALVQRHSEEPAAH
jgi:tRNA A-37 threonylcarbamoyl transferase component Bud32